MTSTTGDHTVTCTATDEAGNTSSATIHNAVQDRIVGLTAPNAHWKAGRTVPVKPALTDAGGNRISDADAAALAADCRVTFSTSGAQTNAPQCMRYDATSHQFIYNWRLGSATGDTTITVAVSYPGTDATTSHSDTISITS